MEPMLAIFCSAASGLRIKASRRLATLAESKHAAATAVAPILNIGVAEWNDCAMPVRPRADAAITRNKSRFRSHTNRRGVRVASRRTAGAEMNTMACILLLDVSYG